MPPSREETLFPGAYALQIVELVARWNIPSDALLHGLDITLDSLRDPSVRIPHLTFRALILRAMELTQEPGLGLWFGLHMRVSSHGFLGFAAMTAKTIGDAIALAERYVPTRTTALAIRSEVQAGVVSLYLEEQLDLGDMREFVVMSIFVGLAGIGAVLTGRTIDGTADVTFPEPPYFRRLASMIPGRVRFSQPRQRLMFAESVLAWPLVMADPSAAELARAQCERELVALTDASRAVTRVRDVVEDEHRGYRSLEDVAHKLHVSPRTLKRQLAASGTTFSELVDQLRRDRALTLLADRSLSIDSIAEQLGYSDVANFTRAFRRWTGTTPATTRKRLPSVDNDKYPSQRSTKAAVPFVYIFIQDPHVVPIVQHFDGAIRHVVLRVFHHRHR